MATAPDDDAFDEQLFAAARRERPAESVKRRAARGEPPARRAFRSARWLLAAAALVAATVLFTRSRGPERLSPRISAEHFAAEPRPVQAPRPRAPVAATSPAPKAPASSAGVAARSVSPKARPATLEEELGMLDRARQALLAGDTGAALAGLAHYDKLATGRHLGAEATLLRIQILGTAGRPTEASALASEFVAQNPNSPLVDRAKSFIQKPVSTEQNQGVEP